MALATEFRPCFALLLHQLVLVELFNLVLQLQLLEVGLFEVDRSVHEKVALIVVVLDGEGGVTENTRKTAMLAANRLRLHPDGALLKQSVGFFRESSCQTKDYCACKLHHFTF